VALNDRTAWIIDDWALGSPLLGPSRLTGIPMPSPLCTVRNAIFQYRQIPGQCMINIKAGLNFPIPLCCSLHHTFNRSELYITLLTM
jgi:hypothetical protein